MNIAINLSSERFRRDRPIFVASVALSVVLTLLLGVMIFLIVGERNRAKDARVGVERLETQLRTLTAEQAKFNATLRQPVNAEVLQRSLLLNTLIERKSISWTRIFADLERVLPFNVKLISVRLPQINSQNEVLLDVIVGAAQPQNIIGFLKKLEESPLFGAASVSQTQTPNQNEPLHRFRISVNYAQKL